MICVCWKLCIELGQCFGVLGGILSYCVGLTHVYQEV